MVIDTYQAILKTVDKRLVKCVVCVSGLIWIDEIRIWPNIHKLDLNLNEFNDERVLIFFTTLNTDFREAVQKNITYL